MNLHASAEKMRHHWDERKYPTVVYVETTNACNATCKFCLYDRMERPVQHMSQQDFERIADKVNERGLKIGAMFCFGEPLADKGLFDKIRYGRSIGVMTDHLGLNTNVSLLTPEKYDDILETTQNLTLSFPNRGGPFEEMTGLSWMTCFLNAANFIYYRDKHRPDFQIDIGCNDVEGHDRDRVREAFAGFNVGWARDAEIHWGSKVITGPIDRSIMYHSWTCDGHMGALQIKPNGDCCLCAYDVIRSETKFANIHTDSWEEIEAAFKAKWKRPSSLCLRCDFWWNYHQMVEGGWKRGEHIDDSWQAAYLESQREWWDEQHEAGNERYLTGSDPEIVWGYLGVEPRAGYVLCVGLGTGGEVAALRERSCAISGLDISQTAIDRSGIYQEESAYKTPARLPSGTYDLATSHLVAQHMTDVDLLEQMRHVIRSLKADGIFAMQFASPTGEEVYREDVEAQRQGLVRRTREDVARLVQLAGGQVLGWSDTKTFDPETATDNCCWNGVRVGRKG